MFKRQLTSELKKITLNYYKILVIIFKIQFNKYILFKFDFYYYKVFPQKSYNDNII